MFTGLIIGAVLGAALGWTVRWLWEAPLPPDLIATAAHIAAMPEARRCHTVTYLYSDGTQKTFHTCEGHVLNITLGRLHAPPGAHVVDRWGGVHT